MASKETLAIRAQAERSHNREHSVPLYLTSSFTFDDAEMGRAMFADEIAGNVYSRYSNPNVDEFIRKVCLLEGGEEGIAFASGMAAIFATFAGSLQAGDHVVASKALFGSAIQILNKIMPKWGVTTTFVEGHDLSQWEAATQENTKFYFCESPSNPGLELTDLRALSAIAKRHQVVLAVDNCFATPVIQNPIELGADLVMHSATKYMDGQGRVLGGILVGRKDLIEPIRFFARHTGPALSPFNAWVLSKSLETLFVRMRAHSENALTLARTLEGNAALQAVHYPFLESHPQYELAKQQMKYGGAILTLEVKGGFEAVNALTQHLEIASISPNLGDTRTILTHPASTTHSKLSKEERAEVGITDGLVRIAVGLENIDDLIEDFQQALAKVAASQEAATV
ncbi:O-succinylhomoserine sulfhydrylase [Siphonobacter sp.]|uniref:O-succinylhomoserine sulfhydrylase n=1 Tax=Siphonobacter sp. TaxID=1869184 RepID=UPI003B3BB1EE